jgi:hypothetical protein
MVRDRRAIDQALRGITSPPVYDHRSAAAEPLLWAVDAVVWAVGADDDWRRRIERIVVFRRIEP